MYLTRSPLLFVGCLFLVSFTAFTRGCDFASVQRFLQDNSSLTTIDNETTTTADEPETTTTTTTNATTNLRVELHMIARQARGILHIQVNDTTIQFNAYRLEIATDPGTNQISLDWYYAESLEETDVALRTLLVPGGNYSQEELTGNNTFSFRATHQDWSKIGAILLCDRYSEDNRILASALIQKLKPGPAADLLAPQPTLFDHCWSVSNTARLRWTVNSQDPHIEIGLEYVANDPANTWMAFGPAAPGIQNRLMGGSDVVMSGFVGDDEVPFGEDYYIGGYDVCTRLPDDNQGNATYDGVCADTVWALDDVDGEQTNNNVELLYSQVLEGVAFLRLRRPLKATTPEWDHDITPGTKQHFVWARGPLLPELGMAKVQFHGYQFGQLKDVDVGEPKWSCPPLQGIVLDDLIPDSSLDGAEDAFAQKFVQRTVLQGDVMEVFWTLRPETYQIHIGARATVRASKWMSIAVGSSMTDAWAWVATLDSDAPQLLAYRMSGLDASTVRLASSEEQNAMLFDSPIVSTSEDGRLSFEVVAQWPLPGMEPGSTSAPLIYAIGPSWTGPETESPRRQDEHSIRSRAPTSIDFATGVAAVGDAPQNSMLIAHGALMFIAWLVLAPLTGMASRYIRDDPCVPDGWPIWIQLHKNFAAAVLALSIVGLILAVVTAGESGRSHFVSSHSRVGLALLVAVVIQNGWGFFRPPAGDTGLHRRSWELFHRIFAVAMFAMAVASVITGSSSLKDYDPRARHGVALSIAWIVSVSLLMTVYELRRAKLRGKPSASNDPVEEAAVLNPEDPTTAQSEPQKPSPWVSNWTVVYAMPFALGLAVLVVLVAVAFSGQESFEMEASASSATVSSSADPADTNRDSTAGPSMVDASDESTSLNSTESVLDSVSSFSPPSVNEYDVLEDCSAWPESHVGDGFCDDFEPFNSPSCGWDGGDCCDTSGALYNCKDPSSPNYGKSSPRGWAAVPVPRNPRYTVSREESWESFVITYNNYYEFGLSKAISDEANKHADFLAPESWYVDVSGLVENPMTLHVPALVNTMHLEERMYRHRCVEAWSITSPWIGFPLSKLLDMVRPKPEAAIVQFISWKNFTASTTQTTTNYPWPYTEAITIDEAKNELTMLTVGNFQKPLTPSQGAPIRLTLPWKYGFKSIKSIEQINFLADTAESRGTFWSTANGQEYGFYANINPDVPHRRWSQATERHYVTGYPGTRLDTTRMNGYQDQVDYLYEDIDDTAIYY